MAEPDRSRGRESRPKRNAFWKFRRADKQGKAAIPLGVDGRIQPASIQPAVNGQPGLLHPANVQLRVRTAFKLAEHNMVGKEGCPLPGGGQIGTTAADQFELSIRRLDQAGVAEPVDNPAHDGMTVAHCSRFHILY